MFVGSAVRGSDWWWFPCCGLRIYERLCISIFCGVGII